MWRCHYCTQLNTVDIPQCKICRKPSTYSTSSYQLPFHSNDASQSFRPKQLKTLLNDDKNNSINDTCSELWTSLHHAVVSCDVTIVEELIKLGSDVNAKTNKGLTPLHLAIQCGSISLVNLLLANNVDIECYTTGEQMTPLAMAVKANLINITTILLSYKPNINCINIIGRTPIMFAASNGNIDMAILLITHGADVHMTDHHAWTIRQIAEYHNHIDFAKYIIMLDMSEKQVDMRQLPPAVYHGVEWDSLREQNHNKKK